MKKKLSKLLIFNIKRMSFEVRPEECLSYYFIENTTNAEGTIYDFVAPVTSAYNGIADVSRLALSHVCLSFLPYTICNKNNKFSVTDGTNTHNYVLPIGYYNFYTPTSTVYAPTILTNTLNVNPYGWNFLVTADPLKDNYIITCNVPFRISSVQDRLTVTLGLIVTNTLSLTQIQLTGTYLFSQKYYICSKRLTENSCQDVHTNLNINNVLGTVDVTNQNPGILNSDYAYTLSIRYPQLKIMDYRFGQMLPSSVDIYILDDYGEKIEHFDGYNTYRMVLEFLIARIRNPLLINNVRNRPTTYNN
jgi:hypothetical protein